jgi:hypothetical protein
MRDLGEDTAAVAELGIGADGAAMVEIMQDLQALLHDGVGLAVLHVGDEADAAGIFLEGGIVEPLALRHRRITHCREGRRRCRHARLAGSAHRQTPLHAARRFDTGSRHRTHVLHLAGPANVRVERSKDGANRASLVFRRLACAVLGRPRPPQAPWACRPAAPVRLPLCGRHAYEWFWQFWPYPSSYVRSVALV